MKNIAKQMKRLLSLVLTLSIVMLSVAGAIVVSAETVVTDTGLIPYGNLENVPNDNPENFAWFAHTGKGNYTEITTEDAYNGAKSLKLTKPVETESGENWRDATSTFYVKNNITLSAGKAYYLTAYIKCIGATTPSVANVWFQAQKVNHFGNSMKLDGSTTIQNKLYTGEAAQWTRVSFLIEGHTEDIKSLQFNVQNLEEFWMDDLCVYEVEVPDTGLIADGHMEYFTVGDTSKYGYGYNGKRTVVDTDAASLDKSIHIGDNGGMSWMYVPFSANADASKTYLFTANVRVDSVNTNSDVSDIFVQFEKASGGNISGDWYSQFRLLDGTTNGEWVRIATTFTGGDAKAAVIGINSSDAYFDDISVTEVKLTDTGLINYGNFEKVPNNNPESFAWFGDKTGVNHYVEISNADSYNGAKSLRVTKPGEWNSEISNFYVKDNLTLSAGKTYLLTAYVKMIGTTELTSDYHLWVQAQKVNHFGESMKLDWSSTIQNKLTNGEKADWTKVQMVISGHTEDIKSLQFNVRNVEEFWIDDLSIVEIEPVVTEGVKLNGDFESLVTDTLDAEIGWFNYEDNYTREVTNEDSNTGAKSLKITKTADQMSKDGVFHMDRGYTSTLLTGKVYELTAYIKVVGAVEPAVNPQLGNVLVEMMTGRFGSTVKINGLSQTQNVLVTGDTDGWKKVTLRIEGHSSDIADLRFMVRYAEEVWFDDISIVEVAPTVVKPDAPESTGLVNYGTFENVPSDNQEHFAYFNENRNQVPSITTEDSYTGVKSLKISKPGDLTATESVFYMNTSAALEVGKAYQLTAYVKVVGAMDEMPNNWMGNLQVEMQPSRFADHMIFINGSAVQQNKLVSGNTDGWQKVTLNIAGHNEEITSMRFMARYAEEIWIDDLSIVEIDYVAPPASTGLVPNGTMEGIAEGSVYGQTWAGAQSVTTAVSKTGFKSLHFNGNGSMAVVHNDLTATTDASKAYLFSAWIKVDSVNNKGGDKYYAWAQFTLSDGKSLQGDFYGQHRILEADTDGEWVKYTKVFTGVEIASFDLWTYSDEAYVDDISLVETTIPNTGLMNNGSFETSSIGAAEPNGGWGWTSGDTAAVTNEDAYSGANSFKIIKTSDHDKNVAYDFPISLSASKAYKLTARVKIKGATDPVNSNFGNLWLQVKNGRFGPDLKINGSNITQNKLWEGTGDTDGWVEVSMYLSGMSADITHLVFYYTSLDEIWFDDITVTELDWADTGLVAGGNFEGLAVGSDFGATFYNGVREVVDTEAYTGDKSLHIGGDTELTVIHKDFTAATDATKTYLLSAWVKANSLTDRGSDIADIFVQFYNDEGNYSGKYYNQIPLLIGETNGEWVKVEYTFTGIAATGMDLYVHSNDTYFDDMAVIALDDTAIVPDGSFETGIYPVSNNAYVLDTVTHTGEKSLKVTTIEADWLENDRIKYITIDPTKTYSLKVWAKADKATNNNTMYIKYTEPDGTNKYKYFALSTEWAEYEMVISQLDATNATSRLALSLGVTNNSPDVTVWFDDLSAEEIPDLYTHVIPTISTGEFADTYFVEDAAKQTYKFDLKVNNGESYDLAGATAKVDIYNYATDEHIATQIIGLDTIAAGETFTKNIKVYGATKFGTYRVAITLSNEDFTTVYDRFFTVAKKSYNQNNFLAINEHGMSSGSGDVHDLVDAAGFGWVCTDISWADNLDAEDNISFTSGADAFIAKCAEDGTKIRANVKLGSRFVADTNGNGYVDTPEEAAAFGDFCSAMATKYAGKVQAYEIMSEYPYQMFDRQNKGDTGLVNRAGEYFAWIMKEAYTNIKAADPDAIVVVGAMNCSYWYNETILVDMLNVFLDDESDGDEEYYFDALGVHPYTNPGNPVDGYMTQRLGVEGTAAMYQQILDDYEIDKPIWLSEVGFSSASESASGNTIKEQAGYLMQLYVLSRSIENVEFLSFYNLTSGYNYVNHDAEAQYGITCYDTAHTLFTKPSYATMQTMNNLLGDITFVSKTSTSDVHKYVFKNAEGKYITAVWAAGDAAADALATVSAGSNTSAIVVDSFGNEMGVTGTSFEFEIGMIPVFVVSDSEIGDITTSAATEKTAIVFASNFNTYIEVVALEGYEYSIDGATYSATAKFEGLNPNTVYTIYCRDTAGIVVGTALFRTSAHGDLDGNASFGAGDLTMMRKLFFTEKDPAGIDVDAKDVNADGEVNILDFVNLKKLTLAAQ